MELEPKNMKILHLITGLELGGAEMMLYKLLSRTDRNRFDSVVISLTEGGPISEKIAALGIPLYSLKMERGRVSPQAIGRLIRLIRRERPAILQTWLYHADLLGSVAARLAGNPKVVWGVHNSYLDMSQYRRLSSWTVKACTRLSRLPRAAVVVSEVGRDYHIKIGYHPREWALITCGFDTNLFRPDEAARTSVRLELGLEPDAPLIGLIARFDPQKDHANFLQAARHLRDWQPDAHFILAGTNITNENSELMRLLEKEQLQNKVHLLGPRHDIPRLSAALDVATTSSAFGEAFPNVIGEAMACGVPCVVTDVGDSAKIVGDTGKVVPPKDPEALAHAWKELLDLPPVQRQQLGLQARQRIEHLFALDRIVNQYETLYEKLALK